MIDEIAVSTEGLSKRFKTSADGILLWITFHCKSDRGETYGLIGPDGAGKTTTIRLLLGLLSRTEGKSSILGFNSMNDAYEIRERVGYIAQQFVLPADLTVMENMSFFANIQGVTQRRTEKSYPGTPSFCRPDRLYRPAGRATIRWYEEKIGVGL